MNKKIYKEDDELKKKALKLHEENKGKLSLEPKVPIENYHHLSLVYSPGVAEPSKIIAKYPEKVDLYTFRGNSVAVISDGSAVLGLGNIGPKAALPVMEGKAVLFKRFAGIDAFPICLDTQDPDEIIKTIKLLEPTFGGINLEDISAPRCFYIEETIKKELDIPIFHDDQHGTAVVVGAAFLNACKLLKKEIEKLKITIIGAGAAGIAVGNFLLDLGVETLIICDSKGIIYSGRKEGMNPYKERLAKRGNKKRVKGTLKDAIKDSDFLIGLSVGNIVTKDMVRSMAPEPVVFALANPIPEIYPKLALEAGASIVGTGRSDFPNQINNVLCFPGIFRGTLDVGATEINSNMKKAATNAICNILSEKELKPDNIIPKVFNPDVAPAVAYYTAKAAIKSGVSKKPLDPEEIKRRTYELTKKYWKK